MTLACADEPATERALPRAREEHWPFAALGIAVVYLALSLYFTRFRGPFELDPDEGNNLIKALLLDHGHKFLSEIWSDQPPLFSYALWGAFKLFGAKVGVGRQLVLGSSAALIFALYDAVLLVLRGKTERLAAHAGAAFAVLCLLLGWGFAVLRVSVMIGMPSLACAMLALWAALRAAAADDARLRRVWLAASGALLGLSVATKLFTAHLLPVVAVTALGSDTIAFVRTRDRRLLWASATFGVAFGGTLLIALLPALTSGNAVELVATHLGSRDIGYRSRHTVVTFVTRDGVTFALAALATVLSLARKNWPAASFIAWLVLSMGALSSHDPIWSHHNQLLLIPGAALAGIAIGCVAQWASAARRRTATVVLLVVSVGLLLVTTGSRLRLLRTPQPRDETRDRRALEFLRTLRLKPGYAASARPIFAFYLGLPVPPNLSVTSAKRFRAGRLDADTIWSEIRQRDVELVLLTKRWSEPVNAKLRSYLASDYRLVYRDPKNDGLEVYQR